MLSGSPLIDVGANRRNTLNKLIQTSHANPMDLATVLPWEEPLDRTQYPKKRDSLWLHGTPWLDELTEEQRLELAWLEIGRDVSTFIFLEETLPPLYVGYINQYGDELDDTIKEYLMIFSKEEIVHTLVFRRYMEKAGLELWKPPAEFVALLTEVLPSMYPSAGIFITFALEWIAEIGAMYHTQHNEVEPITRALFKAHHFDEARHIAFGRWVSEWFLHQAPLEQKEQIKGLACQLVPEIVRKYLYEPEIAEHTSFAFPVAATDTQAIQQIRTSAHNQALKNSMLHDYLEWFRKIGIDIDL